MLTLDDRIRWALSEDLGPGDVTTGATVPESLEGTGRVVAREECVLSGLRACERVFRLLDPRVKVSFPFPGGTRVEPGTVIVEVCGPLRPILSGERTALNFLQRLCGVATLTRKMVDAVAGTGCRILDTRKTTPLWRDLEKEAVRHGGGGNHRFGLFDGVLIKDNHVAAAGGVRRALEAVRNAAPHMLRVEVEVDSLEQLDEALAGGADVIMLDNFDVEAVRLAVTKVHGRAALEVSGGVTLETIRAYAETGVDFISVGALTHSAPAVDLSLEIGSR